MESTAENEKLKLRQEEMEKEIESLKQQVLDLKRENEQFYDSHRFSGLGFD